MKTVKSLILGSAAGLIAMSGAQAADLPVKAKAVEYVRICSLYGAGFYYIPGTDTCIKIGGYLRVDTTFNGSDLRSAGLERRSRPAQSLHRHFASRSRMALTVDTRTATEYGVVRTFGQADFQFTTQATTQQPDCRLQRLARSAAPPTTPADRRGGGYVAVEYVFIQFAGFTFGKSSSAYATPWNGYPGNNSSFLLGGHDTVTGVNNIQYTAQFGNGVSATIGLDDPTVFNRTSAVQPGDRRLSATRHWLGPTPTPASRAPDLVGNIRVDQAWGLFQFSGAVHVVNGSYNILTGVPAGVAVAGPTPLRLGPKSAVIRTPSGAVR